MSGVQCHIVDSEERNKTLNNFKSLPFLGIGSNSNYDVLTSLRSCSIVWDKQIKYDFFKEKNVKTRKKEGGKLNFVKVLLSWAQSNHHLFNGFQRKQDIKAKRNSTNKINKDVL